METRKDTAIFKACEFISQQAPGTLLNPKEPIPGIKRTTWGVMLSQLEVVGVVKSTGWHKPYEVTADAATPPETMVALWRDSTKQPKTTRKHKGRGKEPEQPEPPAEPPPPEEIEIDPVLVLRKILQTGSLDLLIEAAKIEFGPKPEDQAVSQSAEERIMALEREVNQEKRHVADLHTANTRLREELFNERKRIQDLRAQLATASGQTKIIEKIIKVGVVPPGGQASSGGQGFRYPRTHGQHMSKGGKPQAPSGGGVVAVYRKKKHK